MARYPLSFMSDSIAIKDDVIFSLTNVLSRALVKFLNIAFHFLGSCDESFSWIIYDIITLKVFVRYHSLCY